MRFVMCLLMETGPFHQRDLCRIWRLSFSGRVVKAAIDRRGDSGFRIVDPVLRPMLLAAWITGTLRKSRPSVITGSKGRKPPWERSGPASAFTRSARKIPRLALGPDPGINRFAKASSGSPRSLSRFRRSSISKNPRWPPIPHHPPIPAQALKHDPAEMVRISEPFSLGLAGA
ncbi:MAG: hypothetical protein IOC52_01130 [Methylobacterium sp.]|nr:hypothetical protein [Methylobacterium sp.]